MKNVKRGIKAAPLYKMDCRKERDEKMKSYTYKPVGVCSRQITVELDDQDVITRVEFVGGCSGNTQGVAKLALGRKAQEIIALAGGIRCGAKETSCPDQLSVALRKALER